MIHKHTKIIAAILTTAFLLSLGGFVVFWHVVEGHRAELREALTAAANMREQERTLAALVETVETSASDRKALDTLILTDEGVIDLLALIEEIGKEQGVTLTTSALNVLPLDATFETLAVTIDIEGEYEALSRTLKIIETIPYHAAVPRVFIQQTGEETQTWAGTITLHVTKFKKS